ncbi:hypothetical protein BJP25_05365 [Actinokineospora bangkokensis]|uniref:Uncharacterized protein n=1 Tax=Actinokineospora bangkokensis TaxID=1193682 RepID=A0A1Q9LBW4_9PSEU|nr:hypothetical protein BJP25_05365 [Actinokineospora bangkokensis]
MHPISLWIIAPLTHIASATRGTPLVGRARSGEDGGTGADDHLIGGRQGEPVAEGNRHLR